MSAESWLNEQQANLDGEVRVQEMLARHTYYRIGGPARILFFVGSMRDLETAAKAIRLFSLPYFVLGLGSNVLASDEGFPGIILKTNRLNSTLIELEGTLLRVGAGVPVNFLLRYLIEQELKGLELLAGIPGSFGGVVAMNAGTFKGEIGQKLESVTVFSINSGITRVFSRDELVTSYRKAHFLGEGDIVVEARVRVEKGNKNQIKEEIEFALKRREQNQPVHQPSCGSVFKNPSSNLQAWQVIEKCGLRGVRIGGAEFSTKHCNFIVNVDKAKAQDVKALIELAKSKASAELGITLEEEVRYL